MIYNTYDESRQQSDFGDSMPLMPITSLFKDIFGQHPNKKNLIKFFMTEAVQYLWQGAFQDSKEFKDWKNNFRTFSLTERNKMFKYLVKIEQTVGFKILKE